MADGDIEFDLKQLEPGDKVTGLSIGAPEFTPLKTFLQKHAKAYEAQSLARTYLASSTGEKSRPLAYITLVCGEVEINDNHFLGGDVDYRYRNYPAIKLARLAVDSKCRRSGLGRTLVEFALGVVKNNICPSVGCRFMFVDAKRASVEFYESCGFTLLDTEDNKARNEPVMFIDLHKIKI